MSKPSVIFHEAEPDRSARLSGRELLLPTSSEPKGYGLYRLSPLFDTPPKDDLERERYLKSLESYLLVLQPIAELERHRRRSELNITLIPVKRNIELLDDLSVPKQAERSRPMTTREPVPCSLISASRWCTAAPFLFR